MIGNSAVNNLMSRLLRRIIELERRGAAQEMRGKVADVDVAKKMARVDIGKDEDGNPVLSPWLPYKQIAGALKFHQPPTVGQLMTLRSASGDVQQGVLEPFHWSDDNPSPSDDAASNVMTFGDVTVEVTAGGIKATVGGTVYNFTADGFIQTGGKQEHDGLNVGSDHVHGGVVRGGVDTFGPH